MNAFIENCQFYQYPYSQWHRSVSTFMNFGQVSFLCYIVLHCIYTHVLPPCVAPSCAQYTDKMVETCILVYNVIITQLLPTPAKSHYTFNLRDLSKVFQGMLMMEQGKIEVHPQSLQTSV